MELRLPNMQLPTSFHVSCIRAAIEPAGWGRACAESGDPSDAVVSDDRAVRRRDALGANVGERQRHSKLPHLSTRCNPGPRSCWREPGEQYRHKSVQWRRRGCADALGGTRLAH